MTTNTMADESREYGSVKISEDVISVIAGIAAMEIPGVTSMSGGFTGGITEMLGMTNLSKGVAVELGNKEVIIHTHIIVEYGKDIIDISKKVQQNVKKSIETMTGLDVVKVVVNVEGINIKKEEDKKDVETSLK